MAIALIGGDGAAWAQDSKPLFLPPPPSAMESGAVGSSSETLPTHTEPTPLRLLSPDRPDRGDSPLTVDKSHLQIETELFAYARQSTQDERVETFRWGGTEFRLGLDQQTDFEILTESFISTRIESQENSATKTGYGGTTVRIKHNVVGNDGGPFALGLVPFTRFSSTTPLQEFGLGAPMSFELTTDYSLGFSNEWGRREFQTESIDELRDRVSTSVSLSRSWPKRISTFLEYWQLWTPSGDLPLSAALGTGGSFGIGRNSAFDLGIHFGLNKDTEDIVPFTGFTQRF